MTPTTQAPQLRLSLLARNGEVPDKSGLNWWNAGGRVRNPDEAYIPLPFAAKDQAEAVFGSAARGTTFLARLHDGTEMPMRLEGVNTDGRTAKQISSNGDKTLLGQWMLRTVLGVAYGHVVTRADLESYGRTDVLFVREGEHPITGEAIVRLDFAPHRPGSLTVWPEYLTGFIDADLEGHREEESDPG